MSKNYLEMERLRTAIRKANYRLKELENKAQRYVNEATGEITEKTFAQESKAYEEMSAMKEMYPVLFKDTVGLQFRSDVKKAYIENPNIFKVLQTQVDVFLNAKSSKPSEVKKITEYKAEKYAEYLATAEATQQQRYETYLTNRRASLGDSYTLTREQYDRLFDSVYAEYLTLFYDSGQVATIREDTEFGEITNEQVLSYLNTQFENKGEADYYASLYELEMFPDDMFENLSGRR